MNLRDKTFNQLTEDSIDNIFNGLLNGGYEKFKFEIACSLEKVLRWQKERNDMKDEL
jgi:hypothetical protein